MPRKRTLGLGRRHAPDARDENFPLRAVLPRKVVRDRRYWNDRGWWGDQGAAPHCVGFAWAHWLEDGPVGHKGTAPLLKPSLIYTESQASDEWPGEDYDGTSVRAGAKVLQARGHVVEYRWGYTVDEVARAILEVAPVVAGTNWFDDMFEPDDKGFLRPTGALNGGHAYVLNGVNMREEFFRVKNSWGRRWGVNGRAKIAFTDMERLLSQEGEACLAVEAA